MKQKWWKKGCNDLYRVTIKFFGLLCGDWKFYVGKV